VLVPRPAALGGGDPVFYLKRESIYAAIGVVLLLVASRVDYRTLRYLAPFLMLASFGLCLAVLVLGEQVNGARRWLGVGPLAFQPSDPANLSLAAWTADDPADLRRLFALHPPLRALISNVPDVAVGVRA